MLARNIGLPLELSPPANLHERTSESVDATSPGRAVNGLLRFEGSRAMRSGVMGFAVQDRFHRSGRRTEKKLDTGS